MEASKKPGWCVFCQTADQYLKHTSKETVKESKDADPEKPFTPQDWKDGQGDADFEKSFPDTNDLRVIDWLAAGDEAEGPYDAHKDSMSSGRMGQCQDRGGQASTGGNTSRTTFPPRTKPRLCTRARA
ncbi:hypothetical protein T484DRAFT_3061515 [Baffinella frigidus]|nr:hypothetical protein T484DRAFT_3061515 [Cryptophyta sp. CCMP2293]